jgi:hypothetical protein
MKRSRAHSDTQFLVCDVTILRSTLMPGLMYNDLLHRASIRVRPANVRMQFKILAKTTNCSQQKKLFPTFNPTHNPTHKMRCLVRLARCLLIRCKT